MSNLECDNFKISKFESDTEVNMLDRQKNRNNQVIRIKHFHSGVTVDHLEINYV